MKIEYRIAPYVLQNGACAWALWVNAADLLAVNEDREVLSKALEHLKQPAAHYSVERA